MGEVIHMSSKGSKALNELAAHMIAKKARRTAELEARRQQRGQGGSGEKPTIVAPTDEQNRGGAFRLEDVTDKRNGGGSITIGKAFRRTPMIDTLAKQGLISEAEHKALRHYRHHADVADRSLIKDSLNKQVGGSGDGPTHSQAHAAQVASACESAAGSLRDILRSVVVDDLSLSQWAINKSGGIDDCQVKGGARVCRLKPRQKALAIAKLEIQMAAKRVQAELDA